MCVLDIVDRIVARALLGKLEVELDRGVMRAREQEPAGGIDPNLLKQVVERDELPARLDICARSPLSKRWTSCMMISSSRSGSPPNAAKAAFMRST